MGGQVVGSAPAAATPLSDAFTASRDWDGDGHPDIITVDPSGVLRLYRTTPAGIVSWRVLGGDWSEADQVSLVGDFDGDGNNDLLARMRGSNELWLFPGDGSGGFLLPSRIGVGWGSFRQIFSPGDWNGDGHVDLIAQGTTDNALRLYPGNGTGGFGAPTSLAGTWTAYSSMVPTGDFDSDGKVDFISRTTAGALLLVRGNGTGGVASTATVGGGFSAYNATFGIGDYNGDGNTDLIGRLTTTGELKLFPGNGIGSWLSPYPTIGVGWGALRFNDAVISTPAPAVARVPSVLTSPSLSATTELAAANDAALQYHAPGAPVVIADSVNADLGAVLANAQSATLVVRAPSDGEVPTLTDLAASGADAVSLVGAAASFPSAYRNALTGLGYTVDVDLTNLTRFDTSVTIAQDYYVNSPQVVVVSDTAAAERAQMATTFALLNNAPLIAYEFASADSVLEAVGNFFATQVFVSFGATESVVASVATPPAGERELTMNPDQAVPDPWLSMAADQIRAGAHSRLVTMAPADQRIATAQAALLATQRGQIFQPVTATGSDSPGTRFASMQRGDGTALYLVGAITEANRRLTVTNLDDVASRVAAPSLRVTSITQSGTNFTLALQRPTGTTKVEAYDALGTLAGSTTTTTLSITGPLSNFLLVASNSGGAQLATAEFRTNIDATIGATEGVPVFGVTSTGTTSITAISSRATPKMVYRTWLDPLTGEEGEPEALALSCSSTLSFAIPDTSLQWRYDMQEFTDGGQITCGVPAAPTPASFIGGVAFPAPLPAMARSAAEPDLGAGWTYFESQLLEGITSDTARTTAAVWPDLYIRHQAVLEPEYVYSPLPIPGLIWRFGGDHRSPYSPGTSRTQATARIRFDVGTVQLSRVIGESHRWTCAPLIAHYPCWDAATDTAPISDITMPASGVGTNTAFVRMVTHSANPLFPGSPAIDADVRAYVRPGNSYFLIRHDRMPTHVLMWGFAESDYHFSYVARAVGLRCLTGLGACTANVRVQF
ncbi:FG-GAP repeat domain-containing protein [Occultella kanbiaonis]|uniref:FG-GAP repeat domain-containing protein n=1 Tax=Occultella kanbiaonis TaxID=2675754 RepID=UPI0012B9D6F4|nr:VCBS repeat-containing protein [Occultella kanbiaonis]